VETCLSKALGNIPSLFHHVPWGGILKSSNFFASVVRPAECLTYNSCFCICVIFSVLTLVDIPFNVLFVLSLEIYHQNICFFQSSYWTRLSYDLPIWIYPVIIQCKNECLSKIRGHFLAYTISFVRGYFCTINIKCNNIQNSCNTCTMHKLKHKNYDRTSYIVLKNFWLIYNFLWSGRGIICVLQTHFILKKSLLTNQLYP
jgi:hypothetical protein